ncbi:uncharacterized protein MEPE_02132 [Melanopsichium pennsylvanicum]|uniref:Uncharacterized protein n=1 Tax=Melanopsichium pennsylvanicum TaxID=63383 RepID=A0AAJ4XJR2_9BASI|nr:uncharacterized protein MEPE_02132 [Melanopsichium pennsylvanicum]
MHPKHPQYAGKSVHVKPRSPEAAITLYSSLGNDDNGKIAIGSHIKPIESHSVVCTKQLSWLDQCLGSRTADLENQAQKVFPITTQHDAVNIP